MSKIIKLQPTDVALARDLFTLFQLEDSNSSPTQASDGHLQKLLQRSDFHALAAVTDNKVLGGLAAYELVKYKTETVDMFLYEITVKQDHRQQGVGKMLMTELKQLCKKRNISKMFVVTERYNIAALELLKDTGGHPSMDSIMFDFTIDEPQS